MFGAVLSEADDAFLIQSSQTVTQQLALFTVSATAVFLLAADTLRSRKFTDNGLK